MTPRDVFRSPDNDLPDDDDRTDEEIAADEEARGEWLIDRAEQTAWDREDDARW